MYINVNIVLGFLESGKTNYINKLITNDVISNEIIVVIENEFGCSEINTVSKKGNEIHVVENEENINEIYIKEIIKKYSPDRIIIEVNCMENPLNIIDLFYRKSLKRQCHLGKITTLIDAKKFPIYYKNMYSIIKSHIYNSDTIIVNNTQSNNLNDITKEIESINETSYIYEYDSAENTYIRLKQKYTKSLHLDFFILFLLYLIMIFTYRNITSNELFITFQSFFTCFVSLLIESIPFILIGSFLAAIIQILVPVEKFLKLFNKNIFISCILSSVLGIILPVCDCSTIIIVRSLLKKKIPIAPAITFMLASPIVNPISIISTIYAFKDTPSASLYRVFAAIIISNLVGIFIYFTTKKDENILLDNDIKPVCYCSFCNDSTNDTIPSKIKSIFMHMESEFFYVGKFIILGIFISSILQNIIFSNINTNFQAGSISKLLFMMTLGFLLSICSSSDAFIGRSFNNNFSLNSIMGFLVFGPMIDLKNLIMLFGTFKKKFVIKLIFFTIIITFLVLKNFILVC